MREIPRVAESARSTSVICRRFVFGCVAMWCLACLPSRLGAQVGTFGAGALITEANVKPVAEVYLGAPLVRGFRAYGIISWTDDTWSPTFISTLLYVSPHLSREGCPRETARVSDLRHDYCSCYRHRHFIYNPFQQERDPFSAETAG